MKKGYLIVKIKQFYSCHDINKCIDKINYQFNRIEYSTTEVLNSM